MKKLLIKAMVVSLIATGAAAESKCLTNEDRIGFGVIGALQGAIIGGPVGALWAIGSMKYAEMYQNPAQCNQKVLAQKFEEAKEKEVVILQQTVDNKLDVIQEVKEDKKEEQDSYTDLVVYNSFINFDYDSYTVKSVPESLFTIVKKDIDSITIDGHTDSKGTNEYNFALGLKRANEVKQLLVNNSFDEKIIKIVSYGESNPISKNDASNRRVDLKVKYINNSK